MFANHTLLKMFSSNYYAPISQIFMTSFDDVISYVYTDAKMVE